MSVRVHRLKRRPDLLARPVSFAVDRGGLGVSGAGVAHRVRIEAGPDHVARAAAEASDTLRSLRAAEAIVCGALPFAGSRAASLVVPRVAVRSDDRGAVAVVTPRTREPGDDDELAPGGDGPTSAGFTDAVGKALARIAAGDLRKVVLARTITIRAPSPIDVHGVARRLRAADPSVTTFIARYGRRMLVGATPELLVSRRGRRVTAVPVAGSARREGGGERLLCSDKDRREHALVADAVVGALAPLCVALSADDEPRLVSTATLWHLATRVTGMLRDPAPNVLEVAAALHPTPAICGVPVAAALETMRELEGFDRGAYTGLVGWMDAAGDGEWSIALRCAEVDGDTARLFAGNGIVAGSDPDEELAETESKLDTMRRALGVG